MAGRGNPGSRSTFASNRGRDPSIIRLFGATIEDSVINDPFVRLSLSNGQVPDNVEQAHEPAGEQAVVENHRGAEAGSANGRQFRIDLNVCPEDVERAELATAGVEVRLSEQQATTSINGTPFIDLTVSDSDEDMPLATLEDNVINDPLVRLSLSNGQVLDNVEQAHEPAGEQAVVDNHRGFLIDLNICPEDLERAEVPTAGVEVRVPQQQATTLINGTPINFWLPNLNEADSEDAAVRAVEEYERKRKGKSIASGQHVGCSSDFKYIPLVNVATGHELVVYEGRDTRSEREAPTGQHVGCSSGSESVPLLDGVYQGTIDVAPDVVTGPVVSADNVSASVRLMDGVDEDAHDVAPDVVPGNELVVHQDHDTKHPTDTESSKQRTKIKKPSKTLDGKKKMKARKRKTPDVVTGDESPKLRGKNAKPSETLDGKKRRKTPVVITDNGPTEAVPPRRNPRRRAHQDTPEDPNGRLLLLANTAEQDAINDLAAASKSTSERWKSLHACIASAVPVCPDDAGPLVPVEGPNDDVPVAPAEESDDVPLASLVKRKPGRPKKKRREVFKPKLSRFSEGAKTSNYVPKGFLKRTVRANEDRMGLTSRLYQTDGIDVHMSEPDPLGDVGVGMANREDAGQRNQEGGSEPPEIGRPATSGLGSLMDRAAEGTSRGVETDSVAELEEPGPCDQGGSEPPELGGPATSGEGTRRVLLNQKPRDSSAVNLDRFRRRR